LRRRTKRFEHRVRPAVAAACVLVVLILAGCAPMPQLWVYRLSYLPVGPEGTLVFQRIEVLMGDAQRGRELLCAMPLDRPDALTMSVTAAQAIFEHDGGIYAVVEDRIEKIVGDETQEVFALKDVHQVQAAAPIGDRIWVFHTPSAAAPLEKDRSRMPEAQPLSLSVFDWEGTLLQHGPVGGVKVADLALSPLPAPAVSVVEYDGQVWLFYLELAPESGGVKVVRHKDGAWSEPEDVAESTYLFTVAANERELAVVYRRASADEESPQQELVRLGRVDGRFEELSTWTIPAASAAMTGFPGVCVLGDARLSLFVPTLENEIARFDWAGGTVTQAAMPFKAAGPNFIAWMMRAVLLGVGQFALLFLVLAPPVAWVISGMSSKILDIDIAGSSRELASFSRRTNAHVIDIVVSAVLAVAAYLAINGISPAAASRWVQDLFAGDVFPEQRTLFIVSTWFLGGYIAYLTAAEAVTARTLGKLITGIEVIRISTGRQAGVFDAIVRNALRLFEGGFFYLIASIALWMSRNNQRIGDMLAGTLVVRTLPEAEVLDPLGPMPGR